MPLDYARISTLEDRSFTRALLERLDDPQAEDALLTLDDPRAREPLLRILEDLSMGPAMRMAAARVLAGSLDGIRREDALRFWATGDDLLRRRALFAMNVEDAAIIAPIAADPSHPLHGTAIATMMWGFEAPRYQAMKIAALDHPDSAVRVAAADVLLWDEPVSAEEALLRHADDPDPDVATAVIRALEYYPTRRCLARLEALPERDELSDHLRNTLENLRMMMQPRDPDELVTLAPRPAPPSMRLSTEEILAEYSDPDGQWATRRQRLREVDWTAFDTAERMRLAAYFVAHPDPCVREAAWRPISAWDQPSWLLSLLHDPVYGVVKSAAYGLGLTSPDPRVAAALHAHLGDSRVASTHAAETLHAWVAHAGQAAIPALARFALDERETFRHSAIRALIKLGARDALTTLLGLLEEPPLVTWAVHIALLEACRELGLPTPDLDALRAVDNHWLAEAVASGSAVPSTESPHPG